MVIYNTRSLVDVVALPHRAPADTFVRAPPGPDFPHHRRLLHPCLRALLVNRTPSSSPPSGASSCSPSSLSADTSPPPTPLRHQALPHRPGCPWSRPLRRSTPRPSSRPSSPPSTAIDASTRKSPRQPPSCTRVTLHSTTISFPLQHPACNIPSRFLQRTTSTHINQHTHYALTLYPPPRVTTDMTDHPHHVAVGHSTPPPLTPPPPRPRRRRPRRPPTLPPRRLLA